MATGTPQLLWPDRIDQALLDEVVSRIVKAVDPERIVLFGSHARGSARPDSDLDLLVVMDSPPPPAPPRHSHPEGARGRHDSQGRGDVHAGRD